MFFYALMILGFTAMVSCCSKQNGVNATQKEEVAEAVKAIYDHVFACYGNGCDSSDVFNHRYLTKEYYHFIDSVAHYDEYADCFDYDHWVMAQDWDQPKYTLDDVFLSDSLTSRYWASITIVNLGKKTAVHLLMMQEDGRWKIGEMLNDDWEPRSEYDHVYWCCRRVEEGNGEE